MIGVWLFLPLVAAGMVAVSAAVRAAGTEAAHLGREIEAFAEIRAALGEVGREADRARVAAGALRVGGTLRVGGSGRPVERKPLQ